MIIRIFEFFKPEYLNILISSLLNNFTKNSCVEIRKINGNISKIVVGEFNKDKKIVKKIFTSIFLKNSSSLKRFITKTKQKIINKT